MLRNTKNLLKSAHEKKKTTLPKKRLELFDHDNVETK